MLQLVTALIQYGGRNVRGSDLFGQNKTPLSLTRRFFKGLKVSKRGQVGISGLITERGKEKSEKNFTMDEKFFRSQRNSITILALCKITFKLRKHGNSSLQR